jgi:hypothetical protein
VRLKDVLSLFENAKEGEMRRQPGWVERVLKEARLT